MKITASAACLAIVLTHWHGDHVLGVSRLLREWPRARVIATRATGDTLASPAADHFMPGSDPAANARYLASIREGTEFLREASLKKTVSDVERAGFAQAAREYEQFGLEMASARRVPPGEAFDNSLQLPDRVVPVQVKFLGRANTEGDAIV